MNYNDIEDVLEKCFNELSDVNTNKYDDEKVDKTASLFLMAQMKIAYIIEGADLNAKTSKNEVSRLEGEKYFEYKNSSLDKKITENMLTSYIAKDKDIYAAKQECAKYEASLKKWTFIMNSLKDGHIFFRNLLKNKTWSE